MKTLKEYILEADAEHIAIGHFNVSNLEGLHAVVNVAKIMDLPVIIGTSEGERKFMGPRQIVALIKSLRDELNHPIFLNADHTYTFAGIKEAVTAGYDAVIYDGAKKPLKDNIEETKAVVEYVKSVNPEIIVEGEIGYIGQSSKLLEMLPEDIKVSEDALTMPEDAKKFVETTGVDLLAPAVGNIHGKLLHGVESVNAERIKQIREAARIPLVLHGGSGISEKDFHHAIAAGIAIVHINTELRVAYRDALRDVLAKDPQEIAPYRIMENVVYEMEKITETKLKVFSKKTI